MKPTDMLILIAAIYLARVNKDQASLAAVAIAMAAGAMIFNFMAWRDARQGIKKLLTTAVERATKN
jgi:hypothetical protein